MAVLFAFVTIWGSMAHACEGKHRPHASEVVTLNAAGAEAAAADHDHGAADTNGHTHTGKHPCCADLHCYAGVAILSSVPATTPPQSEAKRLGTSNYGHEISLGSSLDRPPRTTVQI